MRTQEDKRHNDFFTVVRLMPTPRCGDLFLVKGCTQPLSSDPKIKLECHICLPYNSIMFVRNLHTLESLTPYTSDQYKKWSK
jgi:hypothetical protein